MADESDVDVLRRLRAARADRVEHRDPRTRCQPPRLVVDGWDDATLVGRTVACAETIEALLLAIAPVRLSPLTGAVLEELAVCVLRDGNDGRPGCGMLAAGLACADSTEAAGAAAACCGGELAGYALAEM